MHKNILAAVVLSMLATPSWAVSPNDTFVTASGPQITDIENNVWAITPKLQITENRVVQPATRAVESLLFLNNTVYQHADGPGWWKWEDQTGWVEIAGDPRTESTPTLLSLTESIQFDGCCVSTLPPSLATGGVRNYSGVFNGAKIEHEGGITFPIQGRVTATVNFANNAVEITFIFPIGGLSNLSFVGSISGNQNSDTQNNFTTSAEVLIEGVDFISADGTFLGANAEE